MATATVQSLQETALEAFALRAKLVEVEKLLDPIKNALDEKKAILKAGMEELGTTEVATVEGKVKYILKQNAGKVDEELIMKALGVEDLDDFRKEGSQTSYTQLFPRK